MAAADPVDVLVVGAGPTGLTLAAELRTFGTRFRIVDRAPDQVHESRALAVQPRTLEVLAGLGIADALVERGNPAVVLQLHTGSRTTVLPLFDIGVEDTTYPFLLFVSQAETEAVLGTHLADAGVTVERGVELVALRDGTDHVACELRHSDGRIEHLTARFVVGSDGARSRVRASADIEFPGSAYPQTFVLADLAADGLDPSAAHAYLAPPGMLFFFPLGRPAPWRLLAMLPPDTADRAEQPAAPGLDELQALADAHTAASVRLGQPAWSTYFRIHHRHADTYRAGRVFLAGDAAHVHSPAGAQGMNTGIQDAANLGWKLALVASGAADPAVLDTYPAERMPVGRNVVAFTDRAFRVATSTHPVLRFARTRIAPRLLRLVARSKRGRAAALRTLAELTVAYRHSPLSLDAAPGPRRGPRAGDRLPNAPVENDGRPGNLHDILAAARFHALLVGPPAAWPPDVVKPLAGHHADLVDLHRLDRHPGTGALHDTDDFTPLADRYAGLVDLHRLDQRPGVGVLCDASGVAHKRLGLSRAGESAVHLVRPDGHIAYRAGGNDLAGLLAYLDRWLPGRS